MKHETRGMHEEIWDAWCDAQLKKKAQAQLYLYILQSSGVIEIAVRYWSCFCILCWDL